MIVRGSVAPPGRPPFHVPAEIRSRDTAAPAHDDPALWCESCWERLDSFTRFDLMYRDTLSAYVRRRCHGRSDEIDDVVQETLLAALQSWGRVDRPERWIFKVAKNKIIALGKVRQRQRGIPPARAETGDVTDRAPDRGALDPALEDVDDVAADQYAVEIVHRLMDEKLTQRQRDAFVENIVNNRPGAEVAEQQRTSRSAIYNRSHTAKDILRKEVEELAAAAGGFFAAVALVVGAAAVAVMIGKIVNESPITVAMVLDLAPFLASVVARSGRRQEPNDDEQRRTRPKKRIDW